MRLFLIHVFTVHFLIAQVVEITYLANEGVLIKTPNYNIIIDGFFRDATSYGYQKIPQDIQIKLETAQEQFNRKTIILVSHPHSDHFDSESLALHIKNNPLATLYSSNQVTSAVLKRLGLEKSKQIVDITPKYNETKQLDDEGVQIEFLRLRHGYYNNYKLENLGHIITLNSHRILHIGDAEVEQKNFEPYHNILNGIDLGLIPDWFLFDQDGIEIVKKMNLKKIIAVHVHPSAIKTVFSKIRSAFPEADAFTSPIEKRVFNW